MCIVPFTDGKKVILYVILYYTIYKYVSKYYTIYKSYYMLAGSVVGCSCSIVDL